MKTLLVVTSLLLSFFLLSFRDPPKVEVDDILEDPGFYDGQKVEVTGVVVEVDMSEKEKTCFLKGSSGRTLRVVLKKKKIHVYCEYSVKGVVHTDPVNKRVYMTLLSCREKEKLENKYVNHPHASRLLFTFYTE